MRKIIILVAALLTALFVSAQSKAWSLQQCVDTALANNRNIKQRELIRQQNEVAWKQSRNNLLPSLNASARHNWSFGRSEVTNGTKIDGNSNNSSFGFSSDPNRRVQPVGNADVGRNERRQGRPDTDRNSLGLCSSKA